MKVQKLESGYWHVRWSSQVWAQWPIGRNVRPEDFFHPSWGATVERLKACEVISVLSPSPVADDEKKNTKTI